MPQNYIGYRNCFLLPFRGRMSIVFIDQIGIILHFSSARLEKFYIYHHPRKKNFTFFVNQVGKILHLSERLEQLYIFLSSK